MKTNNHTPGPWTLEGIQNNSAATISIVIRSSGNASHGMAPYVAEISWPRDGVRRCESVITNEDWANAAFIVRACNSHDALVAQVKSMEDILVRIQPYLEAAESDEVYRPGGVAKMTKLVVDGIKQARATLALAKEGAQ